MPRIRAKNIEFTEVEPRVIATTSTYDVVGNNAYFNKVTTAGAGSGGSTFPVTQANGLAIIKVEALFQGTDEMQLIADKGINFITPAGSYRWSIRAGGPFPGNLIPMSPVDIGDTSYPLRDIYYAGVLIPRTATGMIGTFQVPIKNGAPVDGDYARGVSIGYMVFDTAASKLWVRTGAATWKGIVLA